MLDAFLFYLLPDIHAYLVIAGMFLFFGTMVRNRMKDINNINKRNYKAGSAWIDSTAVKLYIVTVLLLIIAFIIGNYFL